MIVKFGRNGWDTVVWFWSRKHDFPKGHGEKTQNRLLQTRAFPRRSSLITRTERNIFFRADDDQRQALLANSQERTRRHDPVLQCMILDCLQHA